MDHVCLWRWLTNGVLDFEVKKPEKVSVQYRVVGSGIWDKAELSYSDRGESNDKKEVIIAGEPCQEIEIR